MQSNESRAPKKKKVSGLVVMVVVLAVLVAGYFLITAIMESDSLNRQAQEDEELQVTAFAELSGFSYTSDDGQSMTYTRQGSDWTCLEYPDFPLAQTSVKSIVNAFSDIQALRSIRDYVSLEEYGLDSPRYTVLLEDEEGYSTTLLLGNPAPTGWYAMCEGGDRVFVVEASLVSELTFDIYDILMFDRMPGFLQSEVVSVELVYGGSTYKYLISEDPGSEEGYSSQSTKDGQPIDIPYLQVADALDILDSWRGAGCVLYNATADQLGQYGLDEPYYTITLDIFDVSEESSQTIKVAFGELDEDGTNRYFMVNDNMQVLYGLATDSDGVVIDLITEGLEELQSEPTLSEMTGGYLG